MSTKDAHSEAGEIEGPKKFLNLGAGVQSSALLLMSCRGILPKLSGAVFADTGWEREAVYENLEWLKGEAREAGIPVYVVSAGRRIQDDAMSSQVRGKSVNGERWGSMPLHTRQQNGQCGMIRRQCTAEYKIRPIERWLRRTVLGLQSGERAPANAIEQWFGISVDEMRRVRVSRNVWSCNVYPLLGIPDRMLDRPYTRLMCQDWLAKCYPHRQFPRSACIGCPFKTDAEWRKIKANPTEWASALRVDEAIRNCAGMRGQVFLHRRCLPLRMAHLGEDQAELDFGGECLGYCGT